MDLYQKAAKRLKDCGCAAALTGAGISVESGIPDFRSADGLWSRYDPMEYGHIESFRANPGKVWKMLLEIDELVTHARPNAGHHALAELELRGLLKGIVTQNIDGLHHRAGNRRVVEYHGDARELRCMSCQRRWPRESISLDRLPPLCECGGVLRPNFVFFGEGIPTEAYREAMKLVSGCDLLLVVGTSASVVPASYLPIMAKDQGAFLIEVNPERTELSGRLTDLRIAESAGTALPAILEAMHGGRESGE